MIIGGYFTELSKYLVHKRESDTKKLKSEQRRHLHTGLAIESMGHRALPGEMQGNKLLTTQVAYSSCSKQRLGLQRKTILDIQNGKVISTCACGYYIFNSLRLLHLTLWCIILWVLEVLALNLSLETGYPDLWFSVAPPCRCWDSTLKCPWTFPTIFILIHCSCHPFYTVETSGLLSIMT